MAEDPSESRRVFEDDGTMVEGGECRGARTGRARGHQNKQKIELHPRVMEIYRGDPNVRGQVDGVVDLLQELLVLTSPVKQAAALESMCQQGPLLLHLLGNCLSNCTDSRSLDNVLRLYGIGFTQNCNRQPAIGPQETIENNLSWKMIRMINKMLEFCVGCPSPLSNKIKNTV